MKLKKFHSVIENTSKETKEEISVSMDILERIHELLNEKFQGKQKLLADKLGKSEAEVSKWLNGVQNFTLKTILKLQLAFGEPIIAVCSSRDNSTFLQVKTSFKEKNVQLYVEEDGCMKEKFSEVKTLKISSNVKPDLPA